ncbi:MAG TPA: hypothetical protein VJN71_06190 [Nitrososphaerales archaeon]|nr:hypothetical protein [Nitrososphaerales archaeon]
MNRSIETRDLYGATIEKSEGTTWGGIFRNRCKYATSICAEVEPPLEQRLPNCVR